MRGTLNRGGLKIPTDVVPCFVILQVLLGPLPRLRLPLLGLLLRMGLETFICNFWVALLV